MRLPSAMLVSVFFVGALAGCVGQTGASSSTSSAAAPATADAVTFDGDTGAISGTVFDPELNPVAGAEVALLKTDYKTTSAQDGSFSLSKVPPGEYVLAAARLGYDSVSQKLLIEAGKEATVRLVLNPIGIVETYMEVYHFDGFITCNIGYALVLSEECGQGIQQGSGPGIGADPNNHIDWKFNIVNVTNLVEIYNELNWKPASAAAQQLAFNVAHGFTCTPGCGAKKTYCGGAFTNYGRPIVKCDMPFEDIGIKNDKDVPWDITARAWAAPSPATDPPNIVLQQSFQMWRSEFFGEPKPEVYSAVQDK